MARCYECGNAIDDDGCWWEDVDGDLFCTEECLNLTEEKKSEMKAEQC